MRFALRPLITALLLAWAVSAQPSLTVTLYDIAGLPTQIRQLAMIEAGHILLQAGIRVEWVECEVAGRPVNISACASPLGPSRLMLQLLPGCYRKNPLASGIAIIQRGCSVFAGLYTERIRELSRDANWAFSDLLGHAAAHELGHLLLDSSAHSYAGVMRTRWETEDFRRLSHSALVFLPGQLAEAQERLRMVQSEDLRRYQVAAMSPTSASSNASAELR